MKRKKICFVTATRAEYGVLKWLMLEVQKSTFFQLQLIATGAHLLYTQGHTVDQIIEDGFRIDAFVDVQLNTLTTEDIAISMGKMAEMFAPALKKLKPDYLLVLGDRYELLPICNTAFVMRIPIIHLSGGDITEGAIDDGIRNAVTMLAAYHFPGTEDSAKNIIRMRNSSKNVWAVGEPGLDSFRKEKLWTREKLAENLGLNCNLKWALLTYHAETTEELEYNLNAIKNCLRALGELDGYQIIATYSNMDFGGIFINEYLEKSKEYLKDKVIVIPSLGNIRYLSVMKQVEFVMGNSSSGIIEAPALKIPVINIGKRQKGRHLCSNIIQVGTEYEMIKRAIEEVGEKLLDDSEINYWGEGNTSEKIVNILERVIGNE